MSQKLRKIEPMQEAIRRRRAWAAAEAAGVDALLVANGPDVRWLTGFTGSSGAVALRRGAATLFTDGRYTAQARAEARGMRVVIGKGSPGALAAAALAKAGLTSCGFDDVTTTVAGLAAMRANIPAKGRRVFFQATGGVVARLREVKDGDEIARMRTAARLGCSVFNATLERLRESRTEAEFAFALETAARRAGADAMSFDTIVTTGERTARPHGRPSLARLPRRGMMTVDFGVLLDGYCSDMTRTVCLGRASGRERDVYHSVLEAQQAAVAAVRAGVTCGEVDEAARSVLRRARLGKWFTHSTGHGVGLEIHEGPRIAAGQEQQLEAGMVITIEPGVYLPGAFGVRIEDTVVVTAKGCEVITSRSPKDWTEGL
jgi:Xaa-Pro aminopeptidase